MKPTREERAEVDAKVGAAIRAARERRGLTQEQLAELVSVTAPSIASYEKGATSVNSFQLVRIAAALKTSARTFLP